MRNRRGEGTKRAKIVVLAVLILSPVLSADSITISTVQNITDLLFRRVTTADDHDSSLSFILDKNLGRFSLFTSGNYFYLLENTKENCYSQDLGLDYLYSFGEKTALYISLLGNGTFYKSEYSDFNSISLNAFTSLKSYLSQTSILKSDYSFIYRNYKASLLDYWSHSFLLSLDKYFMTRTTAKAEVCWGYKHFMNLDQEKEYGFQSGYSPFAGGNGNDEQQNLSQLTSPEPFNRKGQGIQFFSVSSLLTQSLGSKIGLNFSIMRQWILSGHNPFTAVQDFYKIENPFYDRFSWQGYHIESHLTMLIPWFIELETGYEYSDKRFPGIDSLSPMEEPLGLTRKDHRVQVDASLQKNWARISIFLSYAYIINHSNDPYFDWSGHFFSVGFNWNQPLGGEQ
jgi:hypothetical protein